MTTIQSMSTVEHGSFEASYARCAAGESTLIVPGYGRTIYIDADVIKKWAPVRPIYPAKDGRGFRARRGKQSDYVFAGQLQEVQLCCA
jgi:hypothetical protein